MQHRIHGRVDYQRTLTPLVKQRHRAFDTRCIVQWRRGHISDLACQFSHLIRILCAGGIDTTSRHNHRLTETPRLFFMHFGFMHFWANDDAVKFARTMRAASNHTNATRPMP